MSVVEEFLEHHGIKGMKWGVRRKRGRDGRVDSSAKPKPKAHELSDDDLRAAINRLQMEKQYAQLSGSSKSGKQTATSFIAKHGSAIVGTAVTAFATKQVKDALDNAAVKAAAAKAAKKAAGGS